MPTEYRNRVMALQKLLKKNNTEALFITDPFNIRYLANFTGTNGTILVAPKNCLFFTDFRYRAVAKKALPWNIRFIEIKNNFQKTLLPILKKNKIRTVSFEEKHLTFARYRSFKKNLPQIKFQPVQNIVENLREIKSQQEIRLIIKAQRIAEKIFLEVKNSLIMSSAKVHSGFIGDSVIGEDCRIGAQFSSANVRLDRSEIKIQTEKEEVDSGLKHLGTIIGRNVKIGIKVSTMPGIIIGGGSIIGPSTVVLNNVPENSKYYTKFKETVIKNG